MAQAQNVDFQYFPFPPPQAYPFPPHMPPPFHPIIPPLPNSPPHSTPPPRIPKPPPHPIFPPTPRPKPPMPLNPPPSPVPKPSPHPASPPTPSTKPPPPLPKPTPGPPLPISPPPPHRPILPPPPRHVVPTPPTPSPSPGHHTTIIVVVFVSLGGLFFLAFLAACFIKKRKRKMIQETDDFEIDDRVRVHETFVPGPHGEQAMLVTIEEDIHAYETIRKNEMVDEALHARSPHLPHSLHVPPSTLGTGHHPWDKRFLVYEHKLSGSLDTRRSFIMISLHQTSLPCFKPNSTSQWDLKDYSRPCARKTMFDCEHDGGGKDWTSSGDFQSATKNLSQKLGGSRLGLVFKGILQDSTAIAVKKLENID
ncbi:hypothetical protein Cgig2_012364 [Carnegiea gigantea]|uniref:Uncharacterized protein n=1 Tax=Carnegiea gigantea TaxID=171969 RepID=A0A9Q1KN60_9CARY|nr:hypothetical protein Cgig2_012364 [Carnegiea gigantea]